MSIYFHRNNFETLLFILYSYLLQSLITHKKNQIKKMKYFIPIINILIHFCVRFPNCCRNFVFVLTFAQKAIKNASKQKREYFYVKTKS